MDLVQRLKNDVYQDHPQTKGYFESVSFQYAKIIFARRMSLNYTQKELADLAGVSLKTITRVEAGSNNITIVSYEKIFIVLDISIQEVSKVILEMNEAEDQTTATL